MNAQQTIKPRFTLLEYFYVLLKSVEKSSNRAEVFELFKVLKHKYRLGESKYKTLITDSQRLTKAREDKYLYTFEGVIEEAERYELLKEDPKDVFFLTPAGASLISDFETKSLTLYSQRLFSFIEKKSNVFRFLIEFLYSKNQYKPGLLIFPIYSPRQLQFERSEITTTGDLVEYSWALVTRLQEDIKKNFQVIRDLREKNVELLNNLSKAGLISSNDKDAFDPEKYNVITKRVRDFWINFFLRDIYGYDASWSTFDRWIYRGKQIGLLHATEFYPNFNGKIVYPTSVLVTHTSSSDFDKLYEYSDRKKLYIHSPSWENIQEEFVKSLVDGYFDLRRSNRSYFINLPSLRELVCFKLKISERLFETYLDRAYRLNLAGKLAVRISLEVDKLPEETKAMYVYREPVMVDGRYRNIIAIDVTKGAKA
jgi:hypothetical protein